MARTEYPITQNETLTHIKEGMDVLDSSGEKIGTVKYVQFSDEDPNSKKVDTATPSKEDRNPDRTLVNTIAEAVVGEDDVPEELKERLLRTGYIRIGRGALKEDGFATADQIEKVHEDHLHLKVADKDLFKK